MNWNHIILEGFCMRKISEKKDKYVYEVISFEPYKSKKKENPLYDSKYKTPVKPKYCKNRICYTCFDNDCPHLALAEPPKKEYEKIMKYINKMYEEEIDD